MIKAVAGNERAPGLLLSRPLTLAATPMRELANPELITLPERVPASGTPGLAHFVAACLNAGESGLNCR